MDNIFKISFTVAGVSFQIESMEKDWLEKKEKEYFDKMEKYIGKIDVKQPAKSIKEEKMEIKDLTLNEFYQKYIKASTIGSRTEIAVSFVYYMSRIQKKESIKTSDVGQCFSEIGYPSYNKINFTDILNKARQRGYLNYVNNIWTLTLTGEDFVLNTITASNDK